MKALLIFALVTLGLAGFLSQCTILLEEQGEKTLLFGRMGDYAWVMDGFSEGSDHFFVEKIDGDFPTKKARSFKRYFPAILLLPGTHTLEIRKERLVGVEWEEERLSLVASVQAGKQYILVVEGGVPVLKKVEADLLILSSQPGETHHFEVSP